MVVSLWTPFKPPQERYHQHMTHLSSSIFYQYKGHQRIPILLQEALGANRRVCGDARNLGAQVHLRDVSWLSSECQLMRGSAFRSDLFGWGSIRSSHAGLDNCVFPNDRARCGNCGYELSSLVTKLTLGLSPNRLPPQMVGFLVVSLYKAKGRARVKKTHPHVHMSRNQNLVPKWSTQNHVPD